MQNLFPQSLLIMIVLLEVDFLIVIYFNLYTVSSENTNYINLLPINKLKLCLNLQYFINWEHKLKVYIKYGIYLEESLPTLS